MIHEQDARGLLMIKAKGYAGFDENSPLEYYEFDRRAVAQDDVLIKIQYCGICHSDIHSVRNEWGGAVYPIVPGHEIVGVVAEVGARVTRYKTGDLVGVGCMVGSCGDCSACHDDFEQLCSKGAIFTYNSVDRDHSITKGGYSDHIVVDQKFVLKIPPNLNPAAVAPLLCAGITTYSPLKHWNIGPQDTVGVVGLGGLGHMAVKIAHAMGANVVLFTRTEEKEADAIRLGADEVILTKNPRSLDKHKGRFDFIIDTVSAQHNLDMYMSLLKQDKTLCLLGVSPKPLSIGPFSVIQGRKKLSGSLIGGIAETQEMLDFCGKHQIVADIEMIPMSYINQAYERVLTSDVKYRFVIDMGL